MQQMQSEQRDRQLRMLQVSRGDENMNEFHLRGPNNEVLIGFITAKGTSKRSGII